MGCIVIAIVDIIISSTHAYFASGALRNQTPSRIVIIGLLLFYKALLMVENNLDQIANWRHFRREELLRGFCGTFP